MGSGNIKKFEWKLGRTGLIILISGMTILLCLAFLLGVGVGKNINTYPERIASAPQRFFALFWRPSKVAVQEKKQDGKDDQKDKADMDLAFHDALTTQKMPSMQQVPVEEKNMSPDVVADIIARSPAPAPPEVEMPKKEAASPSQTVAPSKVSVNKPAADKPLKGKEAVSPQFVVHVASLKDKAKADHISKTITSMRYSSKVVKVELKGKGTWYRVMVTGFESKAKAQSAADKISKKVKTKCIIRSAS